MPFWSVGMQQQTVVAVERIMGKEIGCGPIFMQRASSRMPSEPKTSMELSKRIGWDAWRAKESLSKSWSEEMSHPNMVERTGMDGLDHFTEDPNSFNEGSIRSIDAEWRPYGTSSLFALISLSAQPSSKTSRRSMGPDTRQSVLLFLHATRRPKNSLRSP